MRLAPHSTPGSDAFDNAGSGYRLLYVARPPIAFYGLYGVGGPDIGTRRLLDLILYRGRLAEILDCYLGCDCGTDQVRCQIMLDKILYDLDRPVDLYVMGQAAAPAFACITGFGAATPQRQWAAYRGGLSGRPAGGNTVAPQRALAPIHAAPAAVFGGHLSRSQRQPDMD